ncbi:MAG TPA: response regulator transcription factor [Pseudogracilibacillus sp.]|nr:response regulator transcription factor [Pseudogracilibacillus sp.]
MKPTILIVEDEPSIVMLLQYNIEKAGFLTEVANDGEEAVKKVSQVEYDLIVLDLMLPKMNGIEVCKKIRKSKNQVPILMLTAKDQEENKVLGLQIGADDYLTKPFSPRELIARIQAILRRTNLSDTSDNLLELGDIKINLDEHSVSFQGEKLELTRKQFELLIYLIKHENKILSREQLLNAVWDFDFVGDTRMVDVHISHLREKIEKDSKNPEYIKTIHGFGYKMEDPT